MLIGQVAGIRVAVTHLSPADAGGTSAAVEALTPTHEETCKKLLGLADVDTLSIAELRRMIKGAGFEHEDCVEKADLRARAREAWRST